MEHLALTYGSHTFAHTSAKVNVFIMRQDGTNIGGFPNKTLPSVGDGRPQTTAAAVDGYYAHGRWFSQLLGSENNRILRIDVSVTRAKSPYADASVYVLLNSQAPSIRIEADLCTDEHNAVYRTVSVFIGRGWVLEHDRLEELGIVVPPFFRRAKLQAEEIDELITVHQIAPGVATPPDTATVSTPEGPVSVAIPAAPTRRIRVRRKSAKP